MLLYANARHGSTINTLKVEFFYRKNAEIVEEYVVEVKDE